MACEFVMYLPVRVGLNSLCRSSASGPEGSCSVSQVVPAAPGFLQHIRGELRADGGGREASKPPADAREGLGPSGASLVSLVSATGSPGDHSVWVLEWVVRVLNGNDRFHPNLDLWVVPTSWVVNHHSPTPVLTFLLGTGSHNALLSFLSSQLQRRHPGLPRCDPSQAQLRPRPSLRLADHLLNSETCQAHSSLANLRLRIREHFAPPSRLVGD